MTEIRRMLDDEERAEYDALFYAALHDEYGKRRKSRDIAPEMHRLLIDAQKAGRKWASWVLDDAVMAGLGSAARRWASIREVIETVIGERIVRKPAAYGIRRARADGKQEFLRASWGEMTEADLDHLIAARGAQIAAEADTVTIARKLRKLIRDTGKAPVAEALKSIGMSLDEYLATELAA